MRAKRSRDDNLVSKYSKAKETSILEREALSKPKPKTTAEDEPMKSEEMEEESLQVRNDTQ